MRIFAGLPSKDMVATTIRIARLMVHGLPRSSGIPVTRAERRLEGLWSVTVSRNWRITFRVEHGNVFDVDLADYHQELLVMPMKNPPHPGRIVRQDCVEPLGLTITEAAKALGVTRQALNKISHERQSWDFSGDGCEDLQGVRWGSRDVAASPSQLRPREGSTGPDRG